MKKKSEEHHEQLVRSFMNRWSQFWISLSNPYSSNWTITTNYAMKSLCLARFLFTKGWPLSRFLEVYLEEKSWNAFFEIPECNRETGGFNNSFNLAEEGRIIHRLNYDDAPIYLKGKTLFCYSFRHQNRKKVIRTVFLNFRIIAI